MLFSAWGNEVNKIKVQIGGLLGYDCCSGTSHTVLGKLCGMLGIRVHGCCWLVNGDETLKHKDAG